MACLVAEKRKGNLQNESFTATEQRTNKIFQQNRSKLYRYRSNNEELESNRSGFQPDLRYSQIADSPFSQITEAWPKRSPRNPSDPGDSSSEKKKNSERCEIFFFFFGFAFNTERRVLLPVNTRARVCSALPLGGDFTNITLDRRLNF